MPVRYTNSPKTCFTCAEIRFQLSPTTYINIKASTSSVLLSKRRRRNGGHASSNPSLDNLGRIGRAQNEDIQNLDSVSSLPSLNPPVTDDGERDTIRVRIWRALASANGEELSLKQLGSIVGQRNLSDLRSHLTHVERQAKTYRNKSFEWKERRGLSSINSDGNSTNEIKKIKLRKRSGDRGMIFFRLQV
eukprot:CAMPEP_0194110352 /NCGR_PEP_ID=MMETSP0150-20130528/9635_1 /TAXON_ID=122233 /ORGANISM="Chaetoceros debilis, Strain MM31A-1" /LENGTH=189 /DNA_ID=CAMNT_0038799519 /DNA_START=253 /DNA_END=822 /DNA_ORIENTATION=+